MENIWLRPTPRRVKSLFSWSNSLALFSAVGNFLLQSPVVSVARDLSSAMTIADAPKCKRLSIDNSTNVMSEANALKLVMRWFDKSPKKKTIWADLATM